MVAAQNKNTFSSFTGKRSKTRRQELLHSIADNVEYLEGLGVSVVLIEDIHGP